MGSQSPRSSNSDNYVEGEKHFLQNRGKDQDGITEAFQYHDKAIKARQTELTASDRFYREAFKPLHLMDFRFFNNFLDEFLCWCAAHPTYETNDWLFDAEIVPYDLFIEYFSQDKHYLR